MKLIIGNKKYSSWSLRGWMIMHAFGLEFDEVLVPLSPPDIKQTLKQFSPTALVPILNDNDMVIWDSLAINEYINEAYLDGKAWPSDIKQRTMARSITAQMHSGFPNIKAQLPMNIHANRSIEIDQPCKDDIAQMDQILSLALKNKTEDGDYLFGSFGIVDGFLTPVASRFKTYHISVSDEVQAYFDALLNHPSFIAWSMAAKDEDDYIWQDEKGTEISN